MPLNEVVKYLDGETQAILTDWGSDVAANQMSTNPSFDFENQLWQYWVDYYAQLVNANATLGAAGSEAVASTALAYENDVICAAIAALESALAAANPPLGPHDIRHIRSLITSLKVESWTNESLALAIADPAYTYPADQAPTGNCIVDSVTVDPAPGPGENPDPNKKKRLRAYLVRETRFLRMGEATARALRDVRTDHLSRGMFSAWEEYCLDLISVNDQVLDQHTNVVHPKLKDALGAEILALGHAITAMAAYVANHPSPSQTATDLVTSLTNILAIDKDADQYIVDNFL